MEGLFGAFMIGSSIVDNGAMGVTDLSGIFIYAFHTAHINLLSPFFLTALFISVNMMP